MPDRPQVTITVYSAAGRVWSWITVGILGSRDEAKHWMYTQATTCC